MTSPKQISAVSPKRDEVGEADIVLAGPVEHGGADGRRLRDEGDSARLRRRMRDAGVQADAGHHHAQAVGAENAQAEALGLLAQIREACRRPCAFSKLRLAATAGSRRACRARRARGCRPMTTAAACKRPRDRGDRQILDPRIGENAGDGAIGRTDRHDRPLETAMQKILHDDLSGRALPIAGADDG